METRGRASIKLWAGSAYSPNEQASNGGAGYVARYNLDTTSLKAPGKFAMEALAHDFSR